MQRPLNKILANKKTDHFNEKQCCGGENLELLARGYKVLKLKNKCFKDFEQEQPQGT